MPATRTVLAVLVAALLFGGCSTGADVAGLATQDEVLKLRTDVTALQRSVQQARTQTEALSGQVAQRPATSAPLNNSALDAINQRLDTIAGTLAGLTKRVDDLNARVDTLGRQVRAAAVRPGPTGPVVGPAPSSPGPTIVSPPVSPPNRGPTTATPSTAAPATGGLATAEPASPPTAASARPAPTAAPSAPPSATASPVTTPAKAASAPPAAPPVSSPARSAMGALPAQDLYQASYIDFSKGNYAMSIEGFREFLRRYPDHAQASNAQYWIGEGYAALAQQQANAGQAERATEALQRAVQEFRKVVANYPRGERAPTALYKEALTLMDLKQPALAQARLQYLVDNFPQAEEIPLARERLAALKR
jgi:TolA-binding protein